MTGQGGLTRRQFLVLAAAFALPLAPNVWRWVRGEDDAADRLVRLLPHRDSAILVGLAYLAEVPVQADRSALVRGILRDDSIVDSDATLAANVSRQITADFAAGRLAIVDGWVLAETEARLCALAVLA
jgi:hypothetical protein